MKVNQLSISVYLFNINILNVLEWVIRDYKDAAASSICQYNITL